jgi:flagellar basal body L-ring protein FlgH
MDNNTSSVNVGAKKKRVKYNFPLEFPASFTMRDLRKAKSHKIKYITLYARVKKALKVGSLVVSGEKTPAHARPGRRELVYSRVEAPVQATV